MHVKLHNRGLVCLTVSVDESEARPQVLAFLKKQQAVFPNYRLTDSAERWQKALGVEGPPAVLIFDRQGQKVKTFSSDIDFTHAEVEAFVEKLLK